jgi:phage tail-like protein
MGNYIHRWNFKIERGGVEIAKMRTCSEINWEAQDVNIDEGGNPLTHKEPGKIEVPDVTLERGAGIDEEFHDQAARTIDFINRGGDTVDVLKDDYDIVELDRDGTEVRRKTLRNAYVKGYSHGEWDATANEVLIQKIVLRYDFPLLATS